MERQEAERRYGAHHEGLQGRSEDTEPYTGAGGKGRPVPERLTANAQDQLQGQIASATIPISRFASPDLYWVLSGDDFLMDINDTEHPKIICVGNNPDRQEI